MECETRHEELWVRSSSSSFARRCLFRVFAMTKRILHASNTSILFFAHFIFHLFLRSIQLSLFSFSVPFFIALYRSVAFDWSSTSEYRISSDKNKTTEQIIGKKISGDQNIAAGNVFISRRMQREKNTIKNEQKTKRIFDFWLIHYRPLDLLLLLSDDGATYCRHSLSDVLINCIARLHRFTRFCCLTIAQNAKVKRQQRKTIEQFTKIK